MRNHGRSPHTQIHHSAALAYDMRALLQSGRLDVPGAAGGATNSSAVSKERRVVVMGHSMGGLAVMTLLLQQARRRYSASFAAMLQERYGEAEANEQLRAGAASPLETQKTPCQIGDFTVAGGVVVDVTPTQRTIDSINEIGRNIEAMQAMPLYDAATRKPISRLAADKFLESHGISSAATRAFLMTNLTPGLHPEWRCNLDVLQHLSQLRFPFAPHEAAAIGDTTAASASHQCAIQASLDPKARSDAPVQFVFGSESPYNVPDGRDAIAEYFDDYEEFVVPKSGHNPHYERRDDFVAATLPFLKQQFRID
jgi:pimeloyl-ACP methyl ester carboxylesterase